VGSGGSFTILDGNMPAANLKTLPAGTYYWQASYSGDPRNAASLSACGSEVETVTYVPPRPCTSATGIAHFLDESGRQVAQFRLSTDLTAKQRFIFRWEGGKERVRLVQMTRAWCVIKVRKSVFHGTGIAKFNGVPGYTVSFNITISNRGKLIVAMRLRKGRELLEYDVEDTDTSGQVIL
jgi:hypothetical protein